MALKKYLYREDEEVFKKIDATKQKHAKEKFTTKDAMTYLINKGYEAEVPATTPNPEVLEEST